MLSKADLLDRDVMRNAVGNVLDDEKYRKAAHRIRNLLAKRPFPAELELIKTVELAAEFGEMPELRVAGRKLGVIAYYNLDLILLLLFVSAASVSFLILLIYRLFAIIPLSVKVKAE
ncbi:hypothetical protein OESDEN_19028 [Oesophagostomum dentatum]|uniref:glucuronosyltransferase n=1 Tax=Oesophagostomum dentatum TaxID=61180 RepID=A0A0B1SBM0_OESDE|nr:hypothetical protein OESDEN_19028 [Oesophagostomum dentatum]